MKRSSPIDSGYTFVEIIISLILVLFILGGVYFLNRNVGDIQRRYYADSIHVRDFLRLVNYLDEAISKIEREYWEPYPELVIEENAFILGNESSGIIELRFSSEGAILVESGMTIPFSGVERLIIRKDNNRPDIILETEIYGEMITVPFSLPFWQPADSEAL